MARIKYYDTDSASWKYADSNSLAIENILEVELDFDIAAEIDGAFGVSGSFLVLLGDQTGAGGLLHNARITGVEYSDGVDWFNVFSLLADTDEPVVPMLPFVLNDGGDDFTIVAYTQGATSTGLSNATAMRVHYIPIAGTQNITPES